MDNVLLVVNMQEFYVGKERNKKLYDYDCDKLIDNINKRISKYEPEEVFYVKTVGKGLFKGGLPKSGSEESDLVQKLKVVSKNVYEKSKPDAYSNDALGEFMRARNVKRVEICGVDGGNSVGASALGAYEYELKVTYNEACIGTMDRNKEVKYREKLAKNKCDFTLDI
ncbi:MAG: cysteine hydrolase [Ruminococcus sp.]|nr:cysteine hydrolase [Ruminococcus sp.]